MFRLKFFILTILFHKISSECQQSFVTKCDTFKDLQKFKNLEEVKTLSVGSENATNITSVNLLSDIPYRRFRKLSTLFIVRAIRELEPTSSLRCEYKKIPLKYVTLYGNNLTNIEENHFPLLPLKMLSLVNNNIESIAENTFRRHEIENIDISDNSLEVIRSLSLPNTNSTKIITIRNNKLAHIESDSFPVSLRSLNLDGNILRYIQDEVLENLPNLRELTLSGNKFANVPKLNLKKLVILDLSSNEIVTLSKGIFKKLTDLKFLDLSNNKIERPDVLDRIYTPQKQSSLTISLALNSLRGLILDNISLQEQTLVLYGNPWDCDSWPQLKMKISGHESNCDLEFLANPNVPFCVNYNVKNPLELYNNTWNSDVERFREVVKKHEENSRCVLEQNKYDPVYPIDFGCVL